MSFGIFKNQVNQLRSSTKNSSIIGAIETVGKKLTSLTDSLIQMGKFKTSDVLTKNVELVLHAKEVSKTAVHNSSSPVDNENPNRFSL